MNKVFLRDIEKLKDTLLRQAGEVESRLDIVLKSVELRDTRALQVWMERDHEIDEREVAIEEDCLKTLALHQPVAKDLRFVIAVLKINNDLERIGDIVVNIADRGLRMAAFPALDLLSTLMEMGERARAMLKESLDVLVSLNLAEALDIIRRDDEVDTMNHAIVQEVVKRVSIPEKAGSVEALILAKSMARDIERIADHATNIAEDVAYLIDGTIIRHTGKK